jgi:hypothetical protein
MDIYRITRTDPSWRYGRQAGKPEVRFGTKRRASAIARQVREDNENRKRGSELYPQFPYQPVSIIIELAPVTGWTDVTGDWFPAGVGL